MIEDPKLSDKPAKKVNIEDYNEKENTSLGDEAFGTKKSKIVKKILLALVFILISILFGFIIYYTIKNLHFKPNPEDNDTNKNNGTNITISQNATIDEKNEENKDKQNESEENKNSPKKEDDIVNTTEKPSLDEAENEEPEKNDGSSEEIEKSGEKNIEEQKKDKDLDENENINGKEEQESSTQSTKEINLNNQEEQNEQKEMSELYKNIVHVAMSLDSKYVYPTMVSMTSAVVNSSPSTKLIYHLLIAQNVTKEQQKKLKSVESKYRNLEIYIHEMNNTFSHARPGYVPIPAYYRLALPNIVPELDKIIYLDGDTLVFGDLVDLINIDMGDIYFMGFPDYMDAVKTHYKKFPFANLTHYICSGVVLMNLKIMRQNNFVEEANLFVYNYYHKIEYQYDQAVINEMCHDKIRFLPFKYGVFNFVNLEHITSLFTGPHNGKFNASEIYEASINPVICHYVCCFPKVWNGSSVKTPYGSGECHSTKLWYEYANKTDFYDEIYKYYHNNTSI